MIERSAVEVNLLRYAGASALSEEERRLVLCGVDWVNGRFGRTQGDLAERCGLSASILSQFLAGSYAGDVHGAAAAIGVFVVRLENEGEVAALEFVETTTWARIKRAVDNARFDKQPVLIFGESQMGKTAALLHYQSLAPASVRYYRCRGGMTHAGFVRELLRVWGVRSVPHANYDRIRALYEKVKPSDTLLLDEVQLVLRLSASPVDSERIVEEIRSLYDERRIGLAICGTRVASEALTTGRAAPLFAQLLRRCAKPVFVTGEVKVEDLRKFWQAAGLPEPERPERKSWLKRLVATEGLGAFVACIQRGRRKAIKSHQKMGWSHFDAAAKENEELQNGN